MKAKTTAKVAGEESTRPVLTAERLRELLSYAPETGEFRWKLRTLETHGALSSPGQSQLAVIARLVKTFNTRYAGQRAGCLHTASGYWIIRVDNRLYKAHRLAHLYMTGEWPPETIDHRFGDRADNRWDQLRPATQAEQLKNIGLSRANTSGFKGVSWDRVNSKWRASITVGDTCLHLGRFENKADAIAARSAAEERYHGEFARRAPEERAAA